MGKKTKGEGTPIIGERKGKWQLELCSLPNWHWMTFSIWLVGFFHMMSKSNGCCVIVYLVLLLPFFISLSLSLSLLLFFFFFLFFFFLWTWKFGNVISVMWCLLKLKQVDWLNFIADKIEKKGTLHCFLSFLLFFFFFFFFNPWYKSFLLSFWPANKTNNEMVFLYS